MCGIIGVTGKYSEAVRKAAGAFAYRGPDSFGLFMDEEMTLGHNRLSIIDLDARSNQPFFNAEGTVGIVFNGEIYNFPELKKELEASGKYAFRTTSDTEVLVYAYQEWGIGFVRRLRGMFAFALYDVRAKKVVLASDVAAIKPLYYRHEKHSLIFSSEIKGILALMDDLGHPVPPVDHKAVDLYFALGYIPAPLTLYADIKRLPPHTSIVYDFETGLLTEESYDPFEVGESKLTDDQLLAVIKDSVMVHLISDVPVGVFFSGGTDSSLIAAILNEAGMRMETFSVALQGRGADSRYFSAIAKELNLKTHVIAFDQAAFEKAYQEVLGLLDEPIASNSMLPMHALAQYASERVKVVLSGEGGDEFFSGYPRSAVLNGMKDKTNTFGLLEKLYLYTPTFTGKNALFEKLFIFFKRPLSYYLLTMSPSRDVLTAQAWQRAYALLALDRVLPPSYDSRWYLPNDLLRKADLATMYSSVEARVPLVDREVIKASRLIPLAKSSHELKASLKRLLARYLPDEYVYRKKSGFGLHLPVYFAHSETIPKELKAAIDFLKNADLLPLKRIPPQAELMDRYPNLVWAIIVLARVIQNNQRS